jgi:hypothetical protein
LNRSSFCLLLLFAFVSVVASGSRVTACDLCRQTGTTAYHVPAIGGDNLGDAMFPPADSDDSSIAISQFVLQGGQWPQPGGQGSPLTLTYSFENMFDGGLKGPDNVPLPASLIRTSIEQALGLWASVAPLHFVEAPDDGKTYAQGATQFGQLRFRHIYINGPDIPGQPPVAKAQAYFPFSGVPYAGDVEFDHGDPWQEFGTLPVPDVLGAAVHEIGHTLGLGHTDLAAANMYWIFRRSPGLGTAMLHADDIAGVRAIYGAGTGSVTPLAVPEPATGMLIAIALVACLAASRVVPTPIRRAH